MPGVVTGDAQRASQHKSFLGGSSNGHASCTEAMKLLKFRSRKFAFKSWPSCTPKHSSKTTDFPVPEFQGCIGRGRSRIGHRGYYFTGKGMKWGGRQGQVLSKERPATTLWWHVPDFFSIFSGTSIWSTTPEIICQPDMQWFMILFSQRVSHPKISGLWFVFQFSIVERLGRHSCWSQWYPPECRSRKWPQQLTTSLPQRRCPSAGTAAICTVRKDAFMGTVNKHWNISSKACYIHYTYLIHETMYNLLMNHLSTKGTQMTCCQIF